MKSRRQATEERKTTETNIKMTFDVDGTGASTLDTGIPFMDHMLTLFAKHGFFDLDIKASGDLDVDAHHTMEDLGIVMGTAIRKALGDKRGICRYGFFILPMDETLARVVIDLSGRPHLSYNVECPVNQINGINIRLFHEFFQGLTHNLMLNLHIDVIRGDEAHHIHEAVFKAFAKALDQATQLESREKGLPTTKGILE